MGIERFYPEGRKPLYPEATGAYLEDIPREDSFDIAAELAKHPSRAAAYVNETLAANRYTLQELEAKRRAIAWRASVLSSLSPELLASLPPEVQAEVKEWARRLREETA